MVRRVVLLSVTHRVAAGLLSFAAWEALRTADLVLLRDPGSPLAPHLAAAGIAAHDAGGSDAAAVRRALDVDGTAVLVQEPGGEGLATALAAALLPLAEAGDAPEVEVVPGSWDLPGSRLLDLVAVMDRLRSPGGCPWDREQTHTSLVQYLVEETFEAVEAIETGDLVGLREELGDVLLQVAFHARIGEEHAEQPWSIDDVAGGIVDKLVRRHPHVFATDASAPHAGASDAAEVEQSWEALKRQEKQRASALDGVPMGLPALTLAAKLLGRAEKAGAGVPVEPVAAPGPALTDAAAVGDHLFAVVAAARAAGIDAEAALRQAARDYAARVRSGESAVSDITADARDR